MVQQMAANRQALAAVLERTGGSPGPARPALPTTASRAVAGGGGRRIMPEVAVGQKSHRRPKAKSSTTGMPPPPPRVRSMAEQDAEDEVGM